MVLIQLEVTVLPLIIQPLQPPYIANIQKGQNPRTVVKYPVHICEYFKKKKKKKIVLFASIQIHELSSLLLHFFILKLVFGCGF